MKRDDVVTELRWLAKASPEDAGYPWVEVARAAADMLETDARAIEQARAEELARIREVLEREIHKIKRAYRTVGRCLQPPSVYYREWR